MANCSTGRNVVGYKVNREKQTITVRSGFLKKANIYDTKEYNILSGLMKDFPDYTIELANNHINDTRKKQIKGLTYERMEMYVRHIGDAALVEYQRVRAASDIALNPFMYVREWFLGKYENWYDYHFDNDMKNGNA